MFSFLSSDLACCSLMMVAFTWGGFMCTFSFPPTSSRTVAANLVWVFRTCGGCFSMMNVLQGHERRGLRDGALAPGGGLHRAQQAKEEHVADRDPVPGRPLRVGGKAVK